MLEPIFEADFEPVSYGFRPRRRAQDAIAEIHYFGTRGYRWVLDADIEAAFDWKWKDVRRRFTTPTGTWLPITAGEIELKPVAAIPITRYRCRGSKIPNPWVHRAA